MSIDRDKLLDELKRLRRGTGLGGLLADVRLGDNLRTVSKADAGADDATAAGLLLTELSRLIDRLPESMQQVASVALNINIPDLSSQLLDKRISWLASETGRDNRTIRRRIDESMKHLVNRIVAEHDWSDTGHPETAANWFTTSCRAYVRMDQEDGIEAVDEREIIIHGAPTDSISMPFTLPRHPNDQDAPHELQTNLLFGGKFVTRKRFSDSRFNVEIKLPRTLYPGERHRYALQYKIPANQMMKPHYVFVPYYECESFSLLVRFNMDDLPCTIRKVESAFHREIDELQPEENIIEANEAGEAYAEFKNLKTGFGYGIQWRFSETEGS
ncbi:hypothetical protein FXN61_05615 [Lentzea sp. PSKA42]|uniref:Uncharacterized protein n=1 Tax=Lentzea indica TaxID=2604800 RepID=A0ABX1FCA9_9PSEU|nr:hypothetical protein [Lentzea indica]NKE56332.1 hypothetical protein [Lentzea indica]